MGGGSRSSYQSASSVVAARDSTPTHAATSFRYQNASSRDVSMDEMLRRRVESAKAEVKASPLYTGLVKAAHSASDLVDRVPRRGQLCQQLQCCGASPLTLLLRDELLPVDVTDDAQAGHDARHASSATSSAQQRHGDADADDAADDAPGNLHVFDPVLDDGELRYVRSVGGRIRPRNEEGCIVLRGGPVLYVALHCPRLLYSNLLAANWGADALPRVLILGNLVCRARRRARRQRHRGGGGRAASGAMVPRRAPPPPRSSSAAPHSPAPPPPLRPSTTRSRAPAYTTLMRRRAIAGRRPLDTALRRGAAGDGRARARPRDCTRGTRAAGRRRRRDRGGAARLARPERRRRRRRRRRPTRVRVGVRELP